MASADISFWLHMPVNNVASDWPCTFLTSQVFLFSIVFTDGTCIVGTLVQNTKNNDCIMLLHIACVVT